MDNAKKAKIITFANQKGGVGKTTSTLNIGVGLARRGKKVLLIDVDPQANLTMGFGINPDHIELTLNKLLREMIDNKTVPADIDNYIIHTEEGIDIIPSDINLEVTEDVVAAQQTREYYIRDLIVPFLVRYDFILFDCAPSIGILTRNCLTASDEIIIPTQAQIFSFKGSMQLIQSISVVKKYYNPGLKIKGILLTMVNDRTNNAKEIISEIERVYGDKVQIFSNHIPTSVKVSESNLEGCSMYSHDPNNKITKAYEKCVEEILHG